MNFRLHKAIIAVFTILLAAAQAATTQKILESLTKDAVRRCGLGCNKVFMKTTFNFLLAACATGGCVKDFVLRTNALGSASHIQEFCVVSHQFHSPKWSMRIQADLIPSGARIVLVAVPSSSKTERESFRRPFVISDIIPRHQLYIVNRVVKAFCGVTH